MTRDVSALRHEPPDGESLLRAIATADPELHVMPNEPGNVIRLFDRDRTLVAALETPSRINVPGEARRLLGLTDEPPVPCWWLEIRCPINREDAQKTMNRTADLLHRARRPGPGEQPPALVTSTSRSTIDVRNHPLMPMSAHRARPCRRADVRACPSGRRARTSAFGVKMNG